MIFIILPLIKDIALTLAAFTAMFVALYGLNKWKTEHKGKAYFDAAKTLLSSVYSVRNNFEIVRSRWLDASEFPEDYASKNPADQTAEDKANSNWYVYKNRLEPLTKAMNELDVALIEGEVLWGFEVKDEGQKINSSFNRLVRSIKDVIREEYQGISDPRDEETKKYRKDIAASRDSEDELSKQIQSSVEYFESLLKPYTSV
jgi:methyl-accepting chemotaxis protein